MLVLEGCITLSWSVLVADVVVAVFIVEIVVVVVVRMRKIYCG